MGEFTFVVEKPCPICEKTTRVTKIKSRMIADKTDEDFCVHYKNYWVIHRCQQRNYIPVLICLKSVIFMPRHIRGHINKSAIWRIY